MDIGTITAIIVASAGASILGMAGLLKTMVLSRFDKIEAQLDRINRHDTEITLIKSGLDRVVIDVSSLAKRVDLHEGFLHADNKKLAQHSETLARLEVTCKHNHKEGN